MGIFLVPTPLSEKSVVRLPIFCDFQTVPSRYTNWYCGTLSPAGTQ